MISINSIYNSFNTLYTDAKRIGSEYMSVILAVCGENYVKMISDGRVVLFTNENAPVPVGEQFNKLKRINENVILGFAGDKVICEKTVKKLRSAVAKLPKNTVRLSEVAKLTQHILQNTKLGFLKVHFITGGLTSDNRMGLYILNSATNFELEEYFPLHGQHQIKTSLPFGKQESCDQLIEKYFVAEFPKSPQALDKAMIKFVDDIADVDITVNKNHYTIEIIITD